MLPPDLERLADAQGGVFTADQARRHGFDVARPRRAGALTVVRRHVYACTQTLAGLGTAEAVAAHASARLLVTAGDLVASHATAAAMHGFALLRAAPAEPQLTEARRPGPMLRRAGVAISSLPAGHRDSVRGVALTSRVRTLADCARTLPAPAAVATADNTLRAGVSRSEVLAVLDGCGHWPGVQTAREVVRFADARADSPLESGTRWLLSRQGLPAPDLQRTICDAFGRDVADVDMVWLEHRTVLETDGRLKYTAPEALWREKRREDALRLLGFEVVRGYWADLADDCHGLAARIRQAFALNAARAQLPPYCHREKADRIEQRQR